MCRLLSFIASDLIDPSKILEDFARACSISKEYQGHGWGISYLDTESGEWKLRKEINPIWESNFGVIPPTNQFFVHARSAFKDEGITIENNMPFEDENYIFIFNGELRGVKLNVEGRIGAEKLFNFMKKFFYLGVEEGIRKAMGIVNKRTQYIRGSNFMIYDKNTQTLYINSKFNEDSEYFSLERLDIEGGFIISSLKFTDGDWSSLPNNSLEVIPC